MQWTEHILSSLLLPVVLSCGNPGESASQKVVFTGVAGDILGSISGQFGGQSEMAGWVAILHERDTSIARVAEVDAAGIFSFRHVFIDRPQTFALATPDFVFSSVTSIPSPTENTVSQYFRIVGGYLPRLIHKGRVVNFQTTDGIEMTSDLASDQDADGVPDGTASLSLAGFSLQSVDVDLDGIPNEKDPDIDGDGVPNSFDPDDDGDAILDALDADSNGDLLVDTTGGKTDKHFSEGLEWLAVQFVLRPQADGTNKTSLTFTAKLREAVEPLFVQVRGAASLLNAATIEVQDENGAIVPQAWDRRLLDDGLSEDGSAADRIFSKKVFLESGKIPPAHQVTFIQLAFGKADDPWFMEFPYTFPSLKPEAISAEYEPNTRSVHLAGNPFGEVQSFNWAVNVFQADNGIKIYNSPSVEGTARTIVLPDNILDASRSYTFSVVAQVIENISGYSSYTIHSSVLPLAAPADTETSADDAATEEAATE